MDEGKLKIMRNLMIAGCALLVSILSFNTAQAGSITVRDIVLKGNKTEISLDTDITKNLVQVDFVRDIVQFSINNATIYPAKMLHADQSSYSKVFAYQYSPNLVRVRFSVDNNAEQFKNKVKWNIEGKKLLIQFSAPVKAVATQDDNEKTLLQKIAGVTQKSVVEKISESKVEDKVDSRSEAKSDAKKEVAAESHPLTSVGTGKKALKLGGAKSGPSAFRSFLAMFLVVGGLGLILLYVKRKNSGGVQAKKAGNSWLSNLLPQNRKQKPMMEVVATHVLGPKQSIVVMKIRGQQFVLAVTAENIQLITQLDADEAELDLLDDPKVAASIGKMFGVDKKAIVAADVNFNSMLKNSTGAGAIIGRNAYSNNSSVSTGNLNDVPVMAPTIKPVVPVSGARDQIRKRLEGMQ